MDEFVSIPKIILESYDVVFFLYTEARDIDE